MKEVYKDNLSFKFHPLSSTDIESMDIFLIPLSIFRPLFDTLKMKTVGFKLLIPSRYVLRKVPICSTQNATPDRNLTCYNTVRGLVHKVKILTNKPNFFIKLKMIKMGVFTNKILI